MYSHFNAIVDILMFWIFLPDLLDKGLSSTIKVYLAAISACHVGFDGVTPGAHPLVMHFFKGRSPTEACS